MKRKTRTRQRKDFNIVINELETDGQNRELEG